MGSVIPITKNGTTYVLFILGRPPVDGAKFFTQHTDEFQMGIIERPAGYEVPPHQHPAHDKTIKTMSEFLYVEKGKAKVTVFDEDWKPLHEQIITAGDFMLSFRGGHSYTMLEDIRFIEVKQGPYPGDASAKVFKQ